jgi:DNA-binding transcriptional LysR family regulator
MDKLRAMETFVRIVEGGSLTAAAGALDVSALGRAAAGEASSAALDVRLLNRTTRRIALTDEGREYHERCKRILAEVEEAGAAPATAARAARALRVTAPVLFGRLHVAPLAAAFARAHAGVAIDLLLIDRVAEPARGGLDLGVRIGALADSALVRYRSAKCGASSARARDTWRRRAPPGSREPARHACLRFAGLGPTHEWTFVEGGRRLRRAGRRPAVEQPGRDRSSRRARRTRESGCSSRIRSRRWSRRPPKLLLPNGARRRCR